MKTLRWWPVAVAAAAMLSACGGGGDEQAPREHYSKLVSFGDSLSDVGSYAVGGVAALGGGKFTINGAGNRIWVEVLAAQLALPAPCAAQTGLNTTAALPFAAVPVSNHAGCTAYAQGGARVTDPIGPGNAATAGQSASGNLGALTDPVVNQIARHLATTTDGRFASGDLVTVLAGGNDVFWNLSVMAATVGAGGDPTAAAQAAVAALAQAGAELAELVKTQVIAKGATRVVVVNLPDVSLTPMSMALDASTQQLILAMVNSFNAQLAAGLQDQSAVLLVDAAATTRDQTANPAHYGLSNVSTQACDASKTPFNSLSCTTSTLMEGDVSHYLYADDVHPTPYGSMLLAQQVLARMTLRGWL